MRLCIVAAVGTTYAHAAAAATAALPAPAGASLSPFLARRACEMHQHRATAPSRTANIRNAHARARESAMQTL